MGRQTLRKGSAARWLLVLLLIMAFSQFPAASAETHTFGCATIGSVTRAFMGTKDASRFLLSEKGTIQSITVYFANSGFGAKTAIYTDSNGAPRILIAQSNSQFVGQVGWKTFAILKQTLTPGYYWLSVVCNKSSAMGTMVPASANEHARIRSFYSREFASGFGTPSGFDAATTSIYATYTPAALPAPTPIPTPTPTPTPTPGIAVGVYYDQGCTNKVASIDWGTLSIGSTKSLTVYVRNDGSVQVTLTKTVTWHTAGASTYITLDWDYTGQTLAASSVTKLTLTLVVASNTPAAVTDFNFDLTITAEG